MSISVRVSPCDVCMKKEKIRPMSKEVIERTIAIQKELVRGDKQPDEVFRSHNVDSRNFYRDLGDLKDLLEFWKQKTEFIDTEGLFENEVKRDAKKRQLEKKLAKAAGGYYLGAPHYGYDVHDGRPTPNKDFETLCGIMKSFLAGEQQFKISGNYRISRRRLYYILRDRFYRGEYRFFGKTFHGDWQLPVSTEEFDEIQKRLGPLGGRLLPFYEWKDRRRVLKEGGKEKYEEVFRLRTEDYSMTEIAHKTGLSWSTVMRMLTDRKVTGKVEVNGRLVDSEYEAAVDEKTWEKANSVKVPGYKRKQEQASLIQSKIMALLPCYRWQLREKVFLETDGKKAYYKSTSIDKIVRRLKNSRPAQVKEREDGLLQKAWEPFPSTCLETREKGESRKRTQILNVLTENEAHLGEIRSATHLATSTLLQTLQKLIQEGLIEKDQRKYKLSELGRTIVNGHLTSEVIKTASREIDD
jgi:predicted transcriptional regulator